MTVRRLQGFLWSKTLVSSPWLMAVALNKWDKESRGVGTRLLLRIRISWTLVSVFIVPAVRLVLVAVTNTDTSFFTHSFNKHVHGKLNREPFSQFESSIAFLVEWRIWIITTRFTNKGMGLSFLSVFLRRKVEGELIKKGSVFLGSWYVPIPYLLPNSRNVLQMNRII